MMILFIISILFLLLLLLNEYYFHIVIRNTQEHKILRGLKGKYDCVAFGSSYGLYGISFPEKSNGFNFCLGGQFFYYTDKMLREYVPQCLNSGGTVYLIIADLVFAEVGKGLYRPERYPLILSKNSLGEEYLFLNYSRMRFPILFYPYVLKRITKTLLFGVDNSYETLRKNELTYEQTFQQAQQRCASWCRQFHLKDTLSDQISHDLEDKFAKTREILTGMIQFCLDRGYKPVLVVTPVSKAMNGCLSDKFVQKVLFNNIEIANIHKIPFLNYLRDERFQDISLYANKSDYLNARGRKLFTEVLIKDTEKMDYENRNTHISSQS